MDHKSQIAYLLQQGYCCTEALVRLGLWLKHEDNALLAKASTGLCNGMHAGSNCGALMGGCMVLAMFDRVLAAREMIPELTDWFDAEYGMKYGSINCEDLRGDTPRNAMERCKPIVCAVADKCVEILKYNALLEE